MSTTFKNEKKQLKAEQKRVQQLELQAAAQPAVAESPAVSSAKRAAVHQRSNSGVSLRSMDSAQSGGPSLHGSHSSLVSGSHGGSQSNLPAGPIVTESEHATLIFKVNGLQAERAEQVRVPAQAPSARVRARAQGHRRCGWPAPSLALLGSRLRFAGTAASPLPLAVPPPPAPPPPPTPTSHLPTAAGGGALLWAEVEMKKELMRRRPAKEEDRSRTK